MKSMDALPDLLDRDEVSELALDSDVPLGARPGPALALALKVVCCLVTLYYADRGVVVELVKDDLVHGEVHAVVQNDLLDLEVARPDR